MEIFFVIAIAWFFAAMMNISDPRNNERSQRPIPCYEKNEPHDWTYNHNNQLQCTVCGYVAGE
jgi:hypothetical protein